MIIQCKIAIYFNAETQSRRVRRGRLEFRAGVVARSWRWSGSPSERIRRIRRGSARRSFRTPTTSEIVAAGRSWRREWGAFLASDAVARMCGPNCEIYMGDGIRSERLGNIPQSGTWARAVPKNAPRSSRLCYFLPPLNAEEPERARR